MYADAYLLRAAAKIEVNDQDGALNDYRKAAVFSDNEHYIAFACIGRILEGRGDITGALYNYTKAIEVAPKFSGGYFNRGNLLHTKGNFTEAVHNYDMAISLSNVDYLAYYNRALTYKALGNVEKFIEDINKTIDLNPGNVPAKVNRAYYELDQGNKCDAEKEFYEIIKISPKNSLALNGLAIIKGGEDVPSSKLASEDLFKLAAAQSAGNVRDAILSKSANLMLGEGDFEKRANLLSKIADPKKLKDAVGGQAGIEKSIKHIKKSGSKIRSRKKKKTVFEKIKGVFTR